MKVAVTGGTGFAGPAIVQEILDAGHDVTVLEHRQGAKNDSPRLRRVKGGVDDPHALRAAFEGADAVVHLVALIREQPEKGATFRRVHVEGTRNVVEAARGAGARRFLLMSANGVGTMDTPYFATKLAMEEMVERGGFDWTIFRPGFIAAAAAPGEAEGFDDQFARIVDRFPLLPSLSGGRFLIQPVARRDVALAFARALDRPASIGKRYVLVGPERMTWNEYLRRLARLRGRRRALAYAPGWAVVAAARRAPFLFPTPVEPDQLRMLMAGNVGDASEAARDLGLSWTRWEDAVAGLRRA